MMNSIVETTALDLVERLDGDMAGIVFIFLTYDTGSMGALAFDRGVGARDLGEHLENVSRLLQQSKRILTDSGTLFIRTDPFIAAYHQLVANQIFGADRFATQIIVPFIEGPLSDRVWPDYDVFLVYTKSASSVLRIPTRSRTPEEVDEQYRLADDRGPYRLASLTRPAGRTGFNYEWNGIRLPPEREWRYQCNVMDQLDAEGRIVSRPGRGAYLKLYLAEAPRIPVGSIWQDMQDVLLHEHEVWPEFDPVLNLVRLPLALLERIIRMASAPGDRVVAPWDAAGSVALTASRLDRRWTIGVNTPSFTRAATDRLTRHGYRRDTDFHVINFDDLSERLPTVCGAYENYIRGLALQPRPAFVLGEPVPFEESLHVEFKEVESTNPVGIIKETADKYAVGFLNREGGRVLWGIRNRTGVVVGVNLDSAQRDEVLISIVNKLSQLDPEPTPNQYAIKIHPIFNRDESTADKFVVELQVNRGDERELYCTSGGKYFMKTESGVAVLAGRALTEEIKRRASL